MKKVGSVIMFLLLGLTASSQDINSNYFHDLSGFEDSTGTTQLFYRYYEDKTRECSYQENGETYTSTVNPYNNHLRHLDLSTGSDSLYIKDFASQRVICDITPYQLMNFAVDKNKINQPYPFYESIYDLIGGAWIGRPFERMFGAGIGNPYSVLVDTDLNKVLITSPIHELVIKRNKQSNYLNKTFSFSISDSSWMGKNYKDEFPDSLLIDFSVIGINPFRKNQYIGYKSRSIVISNDKGNTYNEIVETSLEPSYFSEHHFKKTQFDADSSTFYVTTSDYNIGRFKKDDGSWLIDDVVRNLHSPKIAVDHSNTGHLYIASSSKVFLSENYGENYQEIQSFNEPVTGIYKKPNSDILYVLTRTFLYKTEPGASNIVLRRVPVSNENEPEIPEQITLHQNYPNPFNPSTTIQFDLKESAFTKLTVYDLLGRKVRELVNEVRPAGTNSIQFNASDLASGVYLYRLETGNVVKTKRLTLIK